MDIFKRHLNTERQPKAQSLHKHIRIGDDGVARQVKVVDLPCLSPNENKVTLILRGPIGKGTDSN